MQNVMRLRSHYWLNSRYIYIYIFVYNIYIQMILFSLPLSLIYQVLEQQWLDNTAGKRGAFNSLASEHQKCSLKIYNLQNKLRDSREHIAKTKSSLNFYKLKLNTISKKVRLKRVCSYHFPFIKILEKSSCVLFHCL